MGTQKVTTSRAPPGLMERVRVINKQMDNKPGLPTAVHRETQVVIQFIWWIVVLIVDSSESIVNISKAVIKQR